jgi:hypothetical protein
MNPDPPVTRTAMFDSPALHMGDLFAAVYCRAAILRQIVSGINDRTLLTPVCSNPRLEQRGDGRQAARK